MAIFNNILNMIFDLLLYPFRELEPIWGLVFVSVVTGILMLVVFKRTSNQEGINNIKDRLKAHLLELRLYKDDIGLSYDALKNIFGANFKYIFYMGKPMLFLMVPMMLILIHLATRYEYRPLRVGESAIISLKLNDAFVLNELALDPPVGIRLETPPLRIFQENQIDWRIKAVQSGDWDLVFRTGDESVTKKLLVGSKLVRLAPRRIGRQLIDQLFNPAEPPIPHSSIVKEIRVQYPTRGLSVWGWQVHWLIIFFGLSIIAGYAMKGVFGVEI